MLKKNLIRLYAKAVVFIRAWLARVECPGAAVYDVPDPRDFKAPIIPKARLPEEFDLGDKVKEFKKEYRKQSHSSCTANSKIYIEEIANTIWNDKLIDLDDRRQWFNQLQTGAREPGGDALQNAQKQFKKEPQGYPHGRYFTLTTKGDELIRQMKLWIYCHFVGIHTGGRWKVLSNGRSNYSELKKTGIYDPFIGGRVIGAHGWMVRGWRKSGWIIKESLLNQWGEEEELGVFIVPFDHTEKMFSKIVREELLDTK